MTNQETHDAVPAMSEPAPLSTSRSARRRGVPAWLVGVVMLVIGVAIGFFGRPLVMPSPAVAQSALMQAVLAQTRHFKGNANAPITMIEFSDFQ